MVFVADIYMCMPYILTYTELEQSIKDLVLPYNLHSLAREFSSGLSDHHSLFLTIRHHGDYGLNSQILQPGWHTGKGPVPMAQRGQL